MNTHQQLLPAAANHTSPANGGASSPPQLTVRPTAHHPAAAKHPQSARAVIPAGHYRLSSCFSFLGEKRHFGCLVAVVGWVLGVGWSAAPAMAAVKMTELYPAPLSGESEWAELYNDSLTDSVNLTGWWFQDQVSSPSVISTLSDLVLLPNSYLTVSWATSKLNNSGDTVVLYDSDNQAQDSVSLAASATGMSWARVGNEQTGYTWVQQSPSPGQANSSPVPSPSPSESPTPLPSPTSTLEPTPSPATGGASPSPTPTPSPVPTPTPTSNPLPVATNNELRVTSVMACPSDSQIEWLEISNTTTRDLSVSGWYITDAANNRRSLSGSISATDTARFEFIASFINNTGETIWLYSPSNQVTQTITLPSCEEKGVAFIQSGSSWIAENEATTSSTINSYNSDTASSTSANSTDLLLPHASPYYVPLTTQQTLSDLQDEYQAGQSATLKKLFQQQNFTLDIPLSQTSLFKEPVELFTTTTKTTANGAWELIIGGSIISISSASQLVQKLVPLLNKPN